MNCWTLYSRAQAWSQRPSELLYLTDPYVCFCVDEAVDMFGKIVEGELNEIKKGRHEKDETFNRRKHQRFLALLGQEHLIKFASPG